MTYEASESCQGRDWVLTPLAEDFDACSEDDGGSDQTSRFDGQAYGGEHGTQRRVVSSLHSTGSDILRNMRNGYLRVVLFKTSTLSHCIRIGAMPLCSNSIKLVLVKNFRGSSAP